MKSRTKGKIIGFYAYLFYRMNLYYKDRAETYIVFCTVLVFHCMTILFFAHSLTGSKESIRDMLLLSNNTVLNRLAIIPLYLLPLFLIVYAVYRSKKEIFWSSWKKFETETPMERKEGTRKIVWYFIISFLLFIGSFLLRPIG
jgi:lysylphosphatidylglycerol synthetase-like protein (DUF2156 family)